MRHNVAVVSVIAVVTVLSFTPFILWSCRSPLPDAISFTLGHGRGDFDTDLRGDASSNDPEVIGGDSDVTYFEGTAHYSLAHLHSDPFGWRPPEEAPLMPMLVDHEDILLRIEAVLNRIAAEQKRPPKVVDVATPAPWYRAYAEILGYAAVLLFGGWGVKKGVQRARGS